MELWDGLDRREEVEDRRKICYLHQATIEDIKKGIVDNTGAIHTIETVDIPESQKFRGQVMVIGLLASLVWVGGFVYSYTNKAESGVVHVELHNTSDMNRTKINNIGATQQVIIVEIKNLVKAVEKSNRLAEEYHRGG
jgi:hypothetical protein